MARNRVQPLNFSGPQRAADSPVTDHASVAAYGLRVRHVALVPDLNEKSENQYLSYRI
jgi:hypothetical protein